MRFRVRVVDYHFGGHISYVKMLSKGNYKLIEIPSDATIFTCAAEFAIIRDNLSQHSKRQVSIDQVVDDALLRDLTRI